MVKIIFALLLTAYLLPVWAKQSVQPMVNISLSKDTVWQREQVIITLEVISDDELSRLDSQPFEQDGFTIIEFKQSAKEHVIKQISKTRIVKRWAVFPFLADQQVLSLPRIRYRPSSGQPIVLALPELTLNVKPLPIYIPPTMPVGKITLQNNWNNDRIVLSKKLLEWSFRAYSDQVVPQTLPAISPFLRSSNSLNILPPKQFVTMEKVAHGAIKHQQNYQVPIKAMLMGKLDLPVITIQYFNPETGKLEKSVLKQPFVLVLNSWLIWSVTLLLACLFIFALIKIVPKLRYFFRIRAQRKQALQLLKNANDYQQIREALAYYSLTKNGQSNTTLDEFAERVVFKKGNIVAKQKRLKELVDVLQSTQFNSTVSAAIANSTQSEKLSINQIGTALSKLLR